MAGDLDPPSPQRSEQEPAEEELLEDRRDHAHEHGRADQRRGALAEPELAREPVVAMQVEQRRVRRGERVVAERGEISATTPCRKLTRRKPNSAGRGRPRTPEKKIAAPTNPRSNTRSRSAPPPGSEWRGRSRRPRRSPATIRLRQIPTATEARSRPGPSTAASSARPRRARSAGPRRRRRAPARRWAAASRPFRNVRLGERAVARRGRWIRHRIARWRRPSARALNRASFEAWRPSRTARCARWPGARSSATASSSTSRPSSGSGCWRWPARRRFRSRRSPRPARGWPTTRPR